MKLIVRTIRRVGAEYESRAAASVGMHECEPVPLLAGDGELKKFHLCLYDRDAESISWRCGRAAGRASETVSTQRARVDATASGDFQSQMASTGFQPVVFKLCSFVPLFTVVTRHFRNRCQNIRHPIPKSRSTRSAPVICQTGRVLPGTPSHPPAGPSDSPAIRDRDRSFDGLTRL